VRRVTLMVNRSDRRFQTLSPAMAREAVRLIVERSARKSIKARASAQAQPAGRIYDCNRIPNRVCTSTLARGRGPYMAGGAGGIRTLSTDCPFSKISGPIRRPIVRLSVTRTLMIDRMECSRPARWSAHAPQDLRRPQQSTQLSSLGPNARSASIHVEIWEWRVLCALWNRLAVTALRSFALSF
jgi:hypothetical protein